MFGGPFPEAIDDDVPVGAADELRHPEGDLRAPPERLHAGAGFIDGVGIRLPTVCVRPGSPNKAASGFFSNIIREPLVGKEAVLPVSEDVRHWHASPRSAVGFLLHAAVIAR